MSSVLGALPQVSGLWHGFPLARAGGLFIALMGLGVLLGAAFPSRRKPFLAMGGAAATVSIFLFAGTLSKPFGRPSSTQLWALGLSILLEAVLIAFVVWRYKREGERTFYLAILFAVGVHFLPMGWAFGPACALLGLSVMFNAAIGLLARRSASLRAFWLVDGVLKLAFGGLMLLGPRADGIG